MRKLLSVAMVLACAVMAGAQTRKGTWLLGTYIGSGYAGTSSSQGSYSTSTTVNKSEGSSFGFGIGPLFGFFVADNVAIGAEIDLSYSHQKNMYSSSTSSYVDTSKSDSVYAYIGPFLQAYLGNAGGKGQPYVKVAAALAMYPSYNGDYSTTAGPNYAYTYTYDKYSAYSLSAELGYEHFLNPSVGLIFFVGYAFNHYEYTYSYDYKVGTDYSATYKADYGSFEFGVGVQIHLGVKI